MTTLIAPTVQAYAEAFAAEQARAYPAIDAIELRLGYTVDRARLEHAAQVLACPLKAHSPNWQHGRVLYAMTRKYLVERGQPVTLLDIGTAKGFSALCLQWALDDASADGQVHSVDILDPYRPERRNTVAELDGLKTLPEILLPWPEAVNIRFRQSTGIAWLESHKGRVNIAFVDGKHSGSVVAQEGRLLAQRQEPGDLVLFDDVQIESVGLAVRALRGYYDLETITVNGDRQYAIGVRNA